MSSCNVPLKNSKSPKTLETKVMTTQVPYSTPSSIYNIQYQQPNLPNTNSNQIQNPQNLQLLNQNGIQLSSDPQTPQNFVIYGPQVQSNGQVINNNGNFHNMNNVGHSIQKNDSVNTYIITNNNGYNNFNSPVNGYRQSHRPRYSYKNFNHQVRNNHNKKFDNPSQINNHSYDNNSRNGPNYNNRGGYMNRNYRGRKGSYEKRDKENKDKTLQKESKENFTGSNYSDTANSTKNSNSISSRPDSRIPSEQNQSDVKEEETNSESIGSKQSVQKQNSSNESNAQNSRSYHHNSKSDNPTYKDQTDKEYDTNHKRNHYKKDYRPYHNRNNYQDYNPNYDSNNRQKFQSDSQNEQFDYKGNSNYDNRNYQNNQNYNRNISQNESVNSFNQERNPTINSPVQVPIYRSHNTSQNNSIQFNKNYNVIRTGQQFSGSSGTFNGNIGYQQNINLNLSPNNEVYSPIIAGNLPLELPQNYLLSGQVINPLLPKINNFKKFNGKLNLPSDYDIAREFVRRYYQTMQTDFKNLYVYYSQYSKMTRNDWPKIEEEKFESTADTENDTKSENNDEKEESENETESLKVLRHESCRRMTVTGQTDIRASLLTLNLTNPEIEVFNVDYTSMESSNILVLVNGNFRKSPNDKFLLFSQVFLISKLNELHYFVISDIFRSFTKSEIDNNETKQENFNNLINYTEPLPNNETQIPQQIIPIVPFPSANNLINSSAIQNLEMQQPLPSKVPVINNIEAGSERHVSSNSENFVCLMQNKNVDGDFECEIPITNHNEDPICDLQNQFVEIAVQNTNKEWDQPQTTTLDPETLDEKSGIISVVSEGEIENENFEKQVSPESVETQETELSKSLTNLSTRDQPQKSFSPPTDPKPPTDLYERDQKSSIDQPIQSSPPIAQTIPINVYKNPKSSNLKSSNESSNLQKVNQPPKFNPISKTPAVPVKKTWASLAQNSNNGASFENVKTTKVLNGFDRVRNKNSHRSSDSISSYKDKNDSGRGDGIKKYPDNQQIFVGNLPKMQKEDLENHFTNAGEGDIIEIRLNKQTNKPAGFAFIVFKNTDSVSNILNSKELFNKYKSNGNATRLNIEPKENKDKKYERNRNYEGHNNLPSSSSQFNTRRNFGYNQQQNYNGNGNFRGSNDRNSRNFRN